MAIQIVKTGASVNDGTGDDARTCFTKINQNFSDSANAASRQVGTAAGNVMEVGAFGVGSGSIYVNPDNITVNSFSHTYDGPMQYCAVITVAHSGDTQYAWQIGAPLGGPRLNGLRARVKSVGVWSAPVVIYNSDNTTIDGNGFIKAASPIVKLFADKIELNDEAAQQQITFEKLGVGDYLVKGSTGFAQEGWYIEMPKDANGNVLVAVVYEQLANNDISVKTYAKMFDPDTGDIVANTARPRDIPSTRWIDLRLEPLPQPDIKPFSTNDTVNTNAE